MNTTWGTFSQREKGMNTTWGIFTQREKGMDRTWGTFSRPLFNPLPLGEGGRRPGEGSLSPWERVAKGRVRDPSPPGRGWPKAG